MWHFSWALGLAYAILNAMWLALTEDEPESRI